MKILFSVKAFLNYLYNNLIDLIWVKKIRFEDGTEMSSLPVGANIYDIKMLSQALIDKGWTYLCNSTKQMLPKAKIPTVYNDIENKYLNCDKQQGALTDLLGNTIKSCLAIDNTYLYTTDNLSGKLKRTILSAFPSTNFEDIGTQDQVSNISDISTTAVGENIIINGEKPSGSSLVYIRIYKKSDMSVLKTIIHFPNVTSVKYFVSFIYVNNKKVFVIGYKPDEDHDNTRYCFVEDKENLTYQDFATGYYRIGLPTFLNGYYYFRGYTTSGNQYVDICKTTNFSDIEVIYTRNNVNINLNMFALDNKLLGGDGYKSTDYGATWSYDSSIPSTIIWDSVFADKTSLYFTTAESNSKVIQTFNLTSYSNVIVLTRRFETGKIAINNGKTQIFVQNTRYDNAYRVWYLGYDNIVYTDSYTINGSTVNIQYYKFEDWKICISDGGTNDTNLDTVYNGLGYENYWLLDRNNEQLCLPRNSNLYTQMYVGDDYEDLTVPTGVWSAVALKSDLSSVGLPPTTYFTGVTGSTIDTHLLLGNAIMVFKNGVLLQNVEDYNISGSIITFVTPLISSDKIAVINGTIDSIDLSTYKQKAQEIIINDTSITIDNILANKNYVFNSNAITDITFTACETSFEETTIEFSTGGSAPTLTDNTGIVWVDGSAPTLNANKSYLIVIFNNLGFVKEY